MNKNQKGCAGRPAFLKQLKKQLMTQFELTSQTRQINGTTLYRIRLTEDHPRWGETGTLGGWVEKKENLQGDAWISDDACVFQNAIIYGNAQVSGTAVVSGNAQVSGDAWVCGNLWISGNECIF